MCLNDPYVPYQHDLCQASKVATKVDLVQPTSPSMKMHAMVGSDKNVVGVTKFSTVEDMAA